MFAAFGFMVRGEKTVRKALEQQQQLKSERASEHENQYTIHASVELCTYLPSAECYCRCRPFPKYRRSPAAARSHAVVGELKRRRAGLAPVELAGISRRRNQDRVRWCASECLCLCLCLPLLSVGADRRHRLPLHPLVPASLLSQSPRRWLSFPLHHLWSSRVLLVTATPSTFLSTNLTSCRSFAASQSPPFEPISSVTSSPVCSDPPFATCTFSRLSSTSCRDEANFLFSCPPGRC